MVEGARRDEEAGLALARVLNSSFPDNGTSLSKQRGRNLRKLSSDEGESEMMAGDRIERKSRN